MSVIGSGDSSRLARSNEVQARGAGAGEHTEGAGLHPLEVADVVSLTGASGGALLQGDGLADVFTRTAEAPDQGLADHVRPNGLSRRIARPAVETTPREMDEVSDVGGARQEAVAPAPTGGPRGDFRPAIPAGWDFDLPERLADGLTVARKAAGETFPSLDGVDIHQLEESRKAYATAPVQTHYYDRKDWHIPELKEVFDLALKPEFTEKKMILDSKTTGGGPDVARRLARQYMDTIDSYPPDQRKSLMERIVVMSPDKQSLDAMKDEIHQRGGDWAKFDHFTYDNESLNGKNTRSTLEGAEGNEYVSVGNPASPLSPHDFDDFLDEVKRTRAEIDHPGSPSAGKKLLAWTINDQDQIRRLAEAGVDGILTDDPQKAKEVIRQLVDQGKIPADRVPDVVAHRGGPNAPDTPENTMPQIERGFQTSDAIEIDVCSARDGAVVWHDNDPATWDIFGDPAFIRNNGLEAQAEYRPRLPDIGTSIRGKRIDELTIGEIRDNYGYDENVTHSVLGNLANSILTNASRAPGTLLNWLGDRLGVVGAPVKWVGNGLNWLSDHVAKPIIGTGVKVADGLLTGAWHGVLDVGKGVWNGVKEIGGGIVNGVGDIFKGNIGKGLGEIGTGIWNGVKSVGEGIVNGVKEVANGIGKAATAVWDGIKSVGSAIGDGIKSVGNAIASIFKGW